MRPLIAANWKMNGALDWTAKPVTLNALISEDARSAVDVLICPPAPYLVGLSEVAMTVNVMTGAQDCHSAVSGAHTGEVSAEMVKECGADYVIIGHSERREGGETDALVSQKIAAAVRAGLNPILCVGEPWSVREAGGAQDYVSQQLSVIKDATIAGIVIAYEPIWAIGSGQAATTEDIAAMHTYIRRAAGPGTRILYGGSVKPANASDIFAVPDVDGALVGGASLEMDDFAAIIRAAVNTVS